MALQLSAAARNAAIDAIETSIGTAPTLEIRTGAPPIDCATADSGTVLATITLPSDWLAAASGGAKTKLGTWQDTSADATGTAAHFRLKQGATCHMQGTISTTLGIALDGFPGDMKLDSTSLTAGQQFTVTTFTLTAGGA